MASQKMDIPHPFDPLTPQEISLAASIIRDAFPNHHCIFRVITLAEPPKAQMLDFLATEKTQKTTPPAREAMIQLYLDTAKDHWQFKVDLSAKKIVYKQSLAGKHSYIAAVDMQGSEAASLADPRVQEEIRALDLPEEAVVCVEPWAYGTDGMHDMTKRIVMCYFYLRLSSHKDANHYAYPLDLCAEMCDNKVIDVYRLPSRKNERISRDSANGKKFDRQKIHGTSEYYPELVGEPRSTTKPYQIIQPDGPSFKTQRNLLTWEKWRMHVGFNYREGMVLHDISYDGRSLFYRLSLSELFVPYGDPRSPYNRKAAFDLGNNGAGVCTNNLKLGCDCLGHIKYFDGWHNTNAGDPLKLPNVICCHEVDDGILWKHTNHRTGNAAVARSRVLILQSIITVGNYEYIFAFQFHQDASINYEVRATGILSTHPIELDDSVPYGTIVAPGVLAPYHQHFFCLRIDPILDGPKNSLEVEESHALPLSSPSIHNPLGIGYTTHSRVIPHETGLDTSAAMARTFKIVNERVRNRITGTPVGYKLVPHPTQPLLAHASSFHATRSEFAAHAVWVTRYAEGELFAAGTHTMQSRGGEGIASWIRQRAEGGQETGVRDQDIVVWCAFGTTHNPRAEDWPVMPCEKMVVGLKPVNFFERNPGLDVRAAGQDGGRSVLVAGNGEGEGEGWGGLVKSVL